MVAMQIPFPPPEPIDVPGPVEQVLLFGLAYLLLLSLALLVLPKKLVRRVIQIAFHKRVEE